MENFNLNCAAAGANVQHAVEVLITLSFKMGHMGYRLFSLLAVCSHQYTLHIVRTTACAFSCSIHIYIFMSQQHTDGYYTLCKLYNSANMLKVHTVCTKRFPISDATVSMLTCLYACHRMHVWLHKRVEACRVQLL
jgi:hypothetical protein